MEMTSQQTQQSGIKNSVRVHVDFSDQDCGQNSLLLKQTQKFRQSPQRAPKIILFVTSKERQKKYHQSTGAPKDGFLSDPLNAILGYMEYL